MHFPSILYLLDGLRASGAVVEVVPSDDGISVDTQRLVEAIDERTAFVNVSHVLFKTSYLHDVAAIAERTRKVGAVLIVDGYQAVGSLTVDTVLNGLTVNSCMVLAAEADGARVETVEGEARDGELSPVQAAFDRNHAVQCGFCTSGMLMSIRELLRDHPTPTTLEIKEGIEGNFCRCTGYQQIIEAVLDASGQLTEETKGELQHVS